MDSSLIYPKKLVSKYSI